MSLYTYISQLRLQPRLCALISLYYGLRPRLNTPLLYYIMAATPIADHGHNYQHITQSPYWLIMNYFSIAWIDYTYLID